MADPRKVVDYTDIDMDVLTFIIDDSTITYDATKVGGSAQVGLAVTISDDQTVELADTDAQVDGKLLSVEADGFCSVQVGGVLTLPGGTSATLTPGSRIVGDLSGSAKGYIQTMPATTAGLLVGKGTILDATTTTAVKVLFPC